MGRLRLAVVALAVLGAACSMANSPDDSAAGTASSVVGDQPHRGEDGPNAAGDSGSASQSPPDQPAEPASGAGGPTASGTGSSSSPTTSSPPSTFESRIPREHRLPVVVLEGRIEHYSWQLTGGRRDGRPGAVCQTFEIIDNRPYGEMKAGGGCYDLPLEAGGTPVNASLREVDGSVSEDAATVDVSDGSDHTVRAQLSEPLSGMGRRMFVAFIGVEASQTLVTARDSAGRVIATFNLQWVRN